MDFRDFPMILGKSGKYEIHPPKLCASLVLSIKLPGNTTLQLRSSARPRCGPGMHIKRSASAWDSLKDTGDKDFRQEVRWPSVSVSVLVEVREKGWLTHSTTTAYPKNATEYITKRITQNGVPG